MFEWLNLELQGCVRRERDGVDGGKGDCVGVRGVDGSLRFRREI